MWGSFFFSRVTIIVSNKGDYFKGLYFTSIKFSKFDKKLCDKAYFISHCWTRVTLGIFIKITIFSKTASNFEFLVSATWNINLLILLRLRLSDLRRKVYNPLPFHSNLWIQAIYEVELCTKVVQRKIMTIDDDIILVKGD